MNNNHYPNTYKPNPHRDPRIELPEVFDPALRPFTQAFRLGNPIFQAPEIARQWFEARQHVIDFILELIYNSRWNEHLVLHGSLLLKACLGDKAREPNDIDLVFKPKHIQAKDRLANLFFDELIQLVKRSPQIGNVSIDSTKIATDAIWTYERADGRRIVFPWQADGIPAGTLQMDIVFGETLFAEPILTLIPTPTRSEQNVLMWSVSQELSLAWKLLWLETDRYPQGKDLYDATLLAEQTYLPFELLRQVLESREDWKDDIKYIKDFSWKSGYPWLQDPRYIDWGNFKLEYPWVEGETNDWHDRLLQALAPTFVNLEI
jgi:hypothetical protein